MINNLENPFLSTRQPECPQSLLLKAQHFKAPRIVVAQAGSHLALTSAKEAYDAGIMQPVLTGNRADIEKIGKEIGWNISDLELIDADGEAESARAAFDLARSGDIDAVMKGHLHTDVLMKAALNRETGIYQGERFVHIFHMTAPDSDKPLLISDAAVNVAPNMVTLQQSVRSTSELARTLGIETPKIALLSATEERIETVPSSIVAGELEDWTRKNIENSEVFGPVALDGIISPQAAQIKGLTNNVAGQADIIIVPDIVSGNVLFKALVYLSGCCAAGVVMGGKVPVLLTSRADPPAARLASAALAAIIANSKHQPL